MHLASVQCEGESREGRTQSLNSRETKIFKRGKRCRTNFFGENSVRFLGPILDFLKTKFLIRKTGEEAPYEIFWENSVRFQVPYKSS